jgi:hypothetical protein
LPPLAPNGLSPEQVGSGEIDDLVSATVQYGADHVQIEIDDLIQLERWRHRKFLPVHGNIN